MIFPMEYQLYGAGLLYLPPQFELDAGKNTKWWPNYLSPFDFCIQRVAMWDYNDSVINV